MTVGLGRTKYDQRIIAMTMKKTAFLTGEQIDRPDFAQNVTSIEAPNSGAQKARRSIHEPTWHHGVPASLKVNVREEKRAGPVKCFLALLFCVAVLALIGLICWYTDPMRGAGPQPLPEPSSGRSKPTIVHKL